MSKSNTVKSKIPFFKIYASVHLVGLWIVLYFQSAESRYARHRYENGPRTWDQYGHQWSQYSTNSAGYGGGYGGPGQYYPHPYNPHQNHQYYQQYHNNEQFHQTYARNPNAPNGPGTIPVSCTSGKAVWSRDPNQCNKAWLCKQENGQFEYKYQLCPQGQIVPVGEHDSFKCVEGDVLTCKPSKPEASSADSDSDDDDESTTTTTEATTTRASKKKKEKGKSKKKTSTTESPQTKSSPGPPLFSIWL